MSTPYIGEIKVISWTYAPKGWAFCDGQLLPINQNQALFSILGTTYGGDGRVNFALPNLQGKTPIHMGNGHTLGETGGEQNHTLSISELPTHIHIAQGSGNDGSTVVPTASVFGKVAGLYGQPAALSALSPTTVSNVGGSQAHLNMQPFLVLNFSIALQGIFPSQN